MSEKSRCQESMTRIGGLISKIRFQPDRNAGMTIVKELIPTEDFGKDDLRGTDIWLVFTDDFSQFTGYERLGIQSKSSETGVEQFLNVGKKKFGRTGEEWKRIGRVLLDGQWADGSIVTDFLTQLMNLMGIYGNEEEMVDFMACLDEATLAAYRQHYLQIEQYRGHLLGWVAGRPIADNGGKLFRYR